MGMLEESGLSQRGRPCSVARALLLCIFLPSTLTRRGCSSLGRSSGLAASSGSSVPALGHDSGGEGADGVEGLREASGAVGRLLLPDHSP